MGVRRVYGLLDPLLRVEGEERGGPRGYGLRVLEYLLKTFLGTSSSASALIIFLLLSSRLYINLGQFTHIHS
jgi:hypothetical protein